MNGRSISTPGCLAMVFILLFACGAFFIWSMQGADEVITEVAEVATSPCGTWDATSGPGIGSWDSGLDVVGGASSNDVWALGYRHITTRPLSQDSWLPLSLPLGGGAYTAHWDGTRWDVNALAIGGIGSGRGVRFSDMEVLAHNDIWVVGASYTRGGFNARNLVLHWDGKEWLNVPTPNASSHSNEISAIAAVATNDIWAVGYYETAPCCPSSTQPLILHWDGNSWSLDVNLASQLLSEGGSSPGDHLLLGAAAVSSDDVWAVGYYREPLAQGGLYPTEPFAVHWDGKAWNPVMMPSTLYNTYPTAIDAISSEDVWAVGVMGVSMHWDGKNWRHVKNPMTDRVAEHLNSVIAVASDDVWAVGADAYNGHDYVLHWNGRKWSMVNTPSIYPHQGFYHAAYVPPNEIWAVGGTLSGLEESAWYSLAARFTSLPCVEADS